MSEYIAMTRAIFSYVRWVMQSIGLTKLLGVSYEKGAQAYAFHCDCRVVSDEMGHQIDERWLDDSSTRTRARSARFDSLWNKVE